MLACRSRFYFVSSSLLGLVRWFQEYRLLLTCQALLSLKENVMWRRIRQFFTRNWGIVVALVVLVVTFVLDRVFLVSTVPVVVGMTPWLFWGIYAGLIILALASLTCNNGQIRRACEKARMMDYVIA